MLLHRWQQFTCMTLFLCVCVIASHISMHVLIKSFRPLMLILGVTLCIHLFFTDGEPLFRVGIVHITREGLHNGVRVIGRIMMLVACATIVTSTTPINRLTRALEHLLKPLSLVHIRPATIALMLGISIRCIPLFFSKIEHSIQSLKARGVRWNTGTVKQRIEYLALIVQLLFASLDRYAEALSMTMRMRGFNPDMPRTSCYHFRFSILDGIACVVTGTVIVLMIIN